MHPTEGMWQEYLDQESDTQVHRDLDRHLAECPDCQRAALSVGRRRLEVMQLLGQLPSDAPARSLSQVLRRPRRRHFRSGLLAAAGVALCVVAATATVRTGTFVRAVGWLLHRRPVESPAPASEPAPVEPAQSTRVAFTPSGPVEILFEAVPQSQEIEILLRSDREVSLTASAPMSISVRKGRLRVANRGMQASYRISLPIDLTEASIRIADSLLFSKQGPVITTVARKTGPGSYVLSFYTAARSSP